MSNARSFRRRLSGSGVYGFLPEIGDDVSEAMKNALAIRNAATVSGVCACGSEGRLEGELRPGEVTYMIFEHQDGCPATDNALRRLAKEGS